MTTNETNSPGTPGSNRDDKNDSHQNDAHGQTPRVIDLIDDQNGIQLGDVLLVGKADPVSRMIQRFSRSDVSHALLVLDRDQAWDAMDHPGNYTEEAGGNRPVALTRYLGGDGLRLVRHLRPTPGLVDDAALIDAVAELAEDPAPFATSGVWLSALLVIATSRAVHEFAETVSMTETHQRFLDLYSDAASDGDQTYVCGEYITRVYARAGVELHFDHSMLMHAFPNLRATPAHVPRGVDRAVAMDRLNAARSIAEEHWGQAPRRPRVVSLPIEIWHFIQSIIRRIHEHIPGERIDLITPSDFLHCPQFQQIGTFHREEKHEPWELSSDKHRG